MIFLVCEFYSILFYQHFQVSRQQAYHTNLVPCHYTFTEIQVRVNSQCLTSQNSSPFWPFFPFRKYDSVQYNQDEKVDVFTLIFSLNPAKLVFLFLFPCLMEVMSNTIIKQSNNIAISQGTIHFQKLSFWFAPRTRPPG